MDGYWLHYTHGILPNVTPANFPVLKFATLFNSTSADRSLHNDCSEQLTIQKVFFILAFQSQKNYVFFFPMCLDLLSYTLQGLRKLADQQRVPEKGMGTVKEVSITWCNRTILL